MIVAAAVRFRGQVFWQPPPARHNHVLHEMRKTLLGIAPMIPGERCEQGFIDEHEQFLNRSQAMQHAIGSGQPTRAGANLSPLRELFSEDLW